MNLQINLILESERRSGSSISKKFIIRSVLIVVPIVLLFVIIVLVVGSGLAKQKRRLAVEREKEIKSVYESVVKLQKQQKKYQGLVNIIDGLQESRPDWYARLREFQKIVPYTIQITRLTLSEAIEINDNNPLRTGGMFLRGRVVSDIAGKEVKSLEMALENRPVFRSFIKSVEIKQFTADDETPAMNDRIFNMDCFFKRLEIKKKEK